MQCFVPLCLSTKHLGTYSKYFFENLKKKRRLGHVGVQKKGQVVGWLVFYSSKKFKFEQG